MARDPVPVDVRLIYAVVYLRLTGRLVESLQQLELGLQEDPLNLTLRMYRVGCLASIGRDEEAAGVFASFWNCLRPIFVCNLTWPLTLRRGGS